MEHYISKYIFSLEWLRCRNKPRLKSTGWKLRSTNKCGISYDVIRTAVWIPWHEGDTLNYIPFFTWRPSSIRECRTSAFSMSFHRTWTQYSGDFNPLNAELNPIYHPLALLGAHHLLHISRIRVKGHFNPLNAELNPICHLLALLEAHHILHLSRIRVKGHYNSLNAELNPICHLLALLGAHPILHLSRIRVKAAMKDGYRNLGWPYAKFKQLDLLACKNWCQSCMLLQCHPVLHSCVQFH